MKYRIIKDGNDLYHAEVMAYINPFENTFLPSGELHSCSDFTYQKWQMIGTAHSSREEAIEEAKRHSGNFKKEIIEEFEL